MPVSYTHLDVYKRQEYNTFGTAAVSKQQAGLGLDIGDVVDARDYFLDKAYRAESGRQAFYESCFCLLYTSRCV